MYKSIKLLIIIFITALGTTCFSQQWIANYQGGHSVGDNLGSDNKAFSIAPGNDGSVYIAGYSGSFSGSSMCLIKYDGNGDTLWTQCYNGGLDTGESKAYAVIVDKLRNIIITGFVTTANGTDIATVKFDPNGNRIWANIYNGSGNGDDKAYAITLDSYNNIYITGYTTDQFLNTHYITIRYDNDSIGTPRWASIYPGQGGAATSITMIGDEYVAVTGSSTNNASISDILTVEYNASTGVQVWQNFLNRDNNTDAKGNAITSDNTGNVYVTGYTMTSTSNYKDLTIIKYDNSGNTTWFQYYNTSGFDNIGNSIGLSGNNDVLVTGTSATGTTDASDNYITLSYSSDGGQEWAMPYNGPGGNTDIAHKLAVSTTENAVYVTGSSKCDSYEGSTDMFTVKYDISTGEALDSARVSTSSANADIAYDVALDSSQNVYVTGYSIFGGNRLNAAGSILTMKFGKGKLSNKNTSHLSVPKNFKLYQNYPNPFNPSTTIKFEIAKSVKVKLVVYDIIGREVQTLIDNNLSAGTHTVTFNKPGISSGVYFYE